MHAIVSQQFALGRLARCPQHFLHLSVGVAKCFLLLAKERIAHTQKHEAKKADRAKEETERDGKSRGVRGEGRKCGENGIYDHEPSKGLAGVAFLVSKCFAPASPSFLSQTCQIKTASQNKFLGSTQAAVGAAS